MNRETAVSRGYAFVSYDTVEEANVAKEALHNMTVEGRALRPEASVSGYEIHMGRTGGADCNRPFLQVDGRPEGAMSADGAVIGSYLHGIFADDAFRRAFLDDLAARRGRAGHFGAVDFEARVDDVLDDLAAHMAQNLDLERLGAIAGL